MDDNTNKPRDTVHGCLKTDGAEQWERIVEVERMAEEEPVKVSAAHAELIRLRRCEEVLRAALPALRKVYKCCDYVFAGDDVPEEFREVGVVGEITNDMDTYAVYSEAKKALGVEE